MSKNDSVLVFHRNMLFRDCLASYLRSSAGYETTAVDHARVDQIDAELRSGASLCLLDLGLPDSLAVEIARTVQDAALDLRLLLLVPDERGRLIECMAAGVHSCILEESSLDELQAALEAVQTGETYCSPKLISTMFSQLPGYVHPPKWLSQTAYPSSARLTPREEQVLQLLSKRKSNKQIAKELCVSVFTVKNHVHNILEKLHVESRIEAVEIARQQSWLSRY